MYSLQRLPWLCVQVIASIVLKQVLDQDCLGAGTIYHTLLKLVNSFLIVTKKDTFIRSRLILTSIANICCSGHRAYRGGR